MKPDSQNERFEIALPPIEIELPPIENERIGWSTTSFYKNGRLREVGRLLPLCRRASTVPSSVYTVGFAGSLGVTTHQFLLKLVKRSSCCRDFDHGVLCGRLRPSRPSLPLDRGVIVTARARACVCTYECERACVRECAYVRASVK